MNTILLNVTSLDNDGIIIIKDKSTSGGGGTGGSNIEYLDVSGMGVDTRAILVSLSSSIKRVTNGTTYITPPVLVLTETDITATVKDTVCVKIDMAEIIANNGEPNPSLPSNITVSGYLDLLASYGYDFSAIPRITEEEFYTLE